MVTAARHRVSLLALAFVLYAVVTVLLISVESPGLGLGHLYYFPIALVAFATGAVAGGFARVAAAGLYNLCVYLNPALPSHLNLEQTVIRLIVYTLMGVLIGWFSSRNRHLVGQLRKLADRDSVTSLPNTRSFQKAI